MMMVNDKIVHGKKGCIKFIFEHGENVHCYEVYLNPPNLCMFMPRFDLRLQMDSDGFSLSEVADKLRKCAESHCDVEKVSIHYTGHRYSVVVVLRELREERLPEIYNSFELTCQEYGAQRPIVTVLGPQHIDCIALSAVDSYMVYSNGDTLNTPATPPSEKRHLIRSRSNSQTRKFLRLSSLARFIISSIFSKSVLPD